MTSLGEYEYPDPDPEEGYEDIAQAAKDFIDALLIKKPKERRTAKQCLSDPWMSPTVRHIVHWLLPSSS